MSSSRRQFLTHTALGIAGAVAAGRTAEAASPDAGVVSQPPPGSPPAFGTAPSVGPEVNAATLAEAEKLMQVQFTPAERSQAAGNWSQSMAPLYERRTGPRKLALEPTFAPASRWDPLLPGMKAGPARERFVRGKAAAVPLPGKDEDIAFAPVSVLSHWLE
ncbi:MAG: twin-arginine translocation signal domain-containing protein, partial [Archangium sp.]